jgi:uncharacterized protein (DUF4415 family)
MIMGASRTTKCAVEDENRRAANLRKHGLDLMDDWARLADPTAIIDWSRAHGSGYQTRINAVCERSFDPADKRKRPSRKARGAPSRAELIAALL